MRPAWQSGHQAESGDTPKPFRFDVSFQTSLYSLPWQPVQEIFRRACAAKTRTGRSAQYPSQPSCNKYLHSNLRLDRVNTKHYKNLRNPRVLDGVRVPLYKLTSCCPGCRGQMGSAGDMDQRSPATRLHHFFLSSVGSRCFKCLIGKGTLHDVV